MKKFLLIPILLIAGAISASACGTCAAHNKADAKDGATSCCAKDAVKADGAKSCCAKSAAPADGAKSCCAK
ncbi:MAG: hypothetical protein ACJAS5_000613 [Lentimonas sp.]|jgi:hypothetical protein